MISRKLDLINTLGLKFSAFLFGPRGVGKSKLAAQFLKYQKGLGSTVIEIDLLSLKQLSRYTQNPGLFRSDLEFHLNRDNNHVIVFIDEIQKFPSLLDEVHYFLESNFQDRIQFLLTGSSARKLRRGGANLLAGRALSLNLHPFSVLELPINLERALQYGTLPKHYLEMENTDLLIEAYVETYLKEEIQAERLVRKLESFQKFLSVAAQMNGRPINFSKVGREVGVSDQTVRDYFSILTDTLLTFELPAWSRSVRKQLATATRYYIFDCGVINGITGEQSLDVRPGNRRYGSLFENFIITEFFRQNDYLKTRRKFYCWRTSDNEEVDLVIDRGLHDSPIAVEIKAADTVQGEDLHSIKLFQKEFPGAPLFCVCRTPNPYMVEGVKVLPWESGIQDILLGAGINN